MSEIAKNIQSILESYNRYDYTLVAVSKTKPQEAIMQAYEGGQLHFGENKVQDLVEKYEALPKDIRWHMIGHLQRNKVKYIAPFVDLIHGVDSEKLLSQINKEGKKADRKVPCLLQIHIAEEDTKFGFSEEELSAFLNGNPAGNYPFVTVKGLMGMATNTDDPGQIRDEFKHLKALYEQYRQAHAFDTLSMGMSGDFPIALEEGSNMIRVGSKIFGKRDYAR